MAQWWNHGKVAKGALVERHPIRVRRNGRDWNAHWEIDGDRLVVCSAYGSTSEPAGAARTRHARAVALFEDLIGGDR